MESLLKYTGEVRCEKCGWKDVFEVDDIDRDAAGGNILQTAYFEHLLSEPETGFGLEDISLVGAVELVGE